MLGSGGVTVMEEGTSMVWAALRLMEFFYHESCGKCSPCREGSSWLVQTLRRIFAKRGRMEDLETLVGSMQEHRRPHGLRVRRRGSRSDHEHAETLAA